MGRSIGVTPGGIVMKNIFLAPFCFLSCFHYNYDDVLVIRPCLTMEEMFLGDLTVMGWGGGVVEVPEIFQNFFRPLYLVLNPLAYFGMSSYFTRQNLTIPTPVCLYIIKKANFRRILMSSHILYFVSKQFWHDAWKWVCEPSYK